MNPKVKKKTQFAPETYVKVKPTSNFRKNKPKRSAKYKNNYLDEKTYDDQILEEGENFDQDVHGYQQDYGNGLYADG